MQEINTTHKAARTKQDTAKSEKNLGHPPFSEILRATQSGCIDSSRNNNTNDVTLNALEKLCEQPGITSAQKMFLNSAYTIMMLKLKESGNSVPQDPSVFLQKIIQLASEFDKNLTGKTSELFNIAQQMGGLSLHT